jgi:proteasome lid subunit RPN8/RPN11
MKTVGIVTLILALAPVEGSQSIEFRYADSVHATLQYLYENLEVEYAFCAYGKQRGKTVTIEQVILPVILQASPDAVAYSYKSCPKKNLLGIGHSHPAPAMCDLSRIDVYSFMTTPLPYAFLVCPSGEHKAFVKTEVRGELLARGLLAEVLGGSK